GREQGELNRHPEGPQQVVTFKKVEHDVPRSRSWSAPARRRPATAHPSGAASALDVADLRRGLVLVAGRTEVLVHGLLPGTVRDHRLQGGVDLRLEVAALLDADAVVLVGHLETAELELALELRLRGVTGEDRVVGGQRVDGLVLQT